MQAMIIQIDVTSAKSEKPSFKFKSSDCSAKLPNLSLKTFNGNPLEYQSFWDCFKATVHQNDSLEDLTKFNYLRSYLQGQALAAIDGLSLNNFLITPKQFRYWKINLVTNNF